MKRPRSAGIERKVLVCRLDGGPESGGLVDAAELGEFLVNTVRRLRSIEADLGHRNKASYRVRRLKTSSPTISIEIATPPSYPAPAPQIAEVFTQSIEFIAGRGPAPAHILPETLYALKDLTLQQYRSIAMVEFRAAGGHSVKVPEKLDKELEHEFLRTAAIEGKVSGFVEAVNVHDQSLMYLYPVMLPVRIACYFPAGLLDVVRTSVKRYTTVSGLQKFDEPSAYPSRVDVEAIEVHPPPADLPTLMSLRGAATQPQGPKSTKEYLALIESE